ncbi:MAG: hypothetical protein KC587_18675 [Nitrospira sp.]|nr:hypothetical protein [Nitrospira sp.]
MPSTQSGKHLPQAYANRVSGENVGRWAGWHPKPSYRQRDRRKEQLRRKLFARSRPMMPVEARRMSNSTKREQHRRSLNDPIGTPHLQNRLFQATQPVSSIMLQTL